MVILDGKIYIEKWFALKLSKLDVFKIVRYKQFRGNDNAFGFISQKFYTKIIDLTPEKDTIFNNFASKKTRTVIRQAIKDGVQFSINEDIDEFISFYNEFAKNKSLNVINNLDKYSNNLKITSVRYKEEILCMHSYLMDHEEKRVRILHSGSLFRGFEDSKKRNLVGRSNRLLHYEDMCYFKDLGFETYDLGGYAYGSDDESLLNINRFKDSFGGTLKQENELQSIVFYLIEKLYHFLGSRK